MVTIKEEKNIVSLIYEDFEGRVEYSRHGCRGILIHNGNMMLTYESKRDRYVIPGGGVEKGEDLLTCLLREMKEETGCIVKAKEPFFETREYFYWDENKEHINHYFLCELVEETEKMSFTEKEVEVGCSPRWVPLEEIISIFNQGKGPAKTARETAGVYTRESLALEKALSLIQK